jgi:preprotein translocase subunit SecG
MLVFMALFLIALVLIQRGRGGGLAGAFGGAGGQSAFGTKAGDLFTRITVGVAAAWILLCILAVNVLGTSRTRLAPTLGGAAATTPGGDAADTAMEPAEPETKPAAGETKPAAGETKPAAEPETKPAEPAAKPANSEAAPAAPAAETKPAAPAAE